MHHDNHDHDIKVLNTLIATTLDSVKGYRDAGADTNGSYSQMFASMADERSRVASDLQAHVRQHGGDPEADSSTAGDLHRGFMNLKDKITGTDDKAVINEVERGEDYIKNKYETALKDDDLSTDCRRIIERAYQSVREGHDKVSTLKHQMA